MGQILSTFHALPDHTQTTTLGGTQYRVRLRWRQRLSGWYLDLLTLDELPIALGRRVSAHWTPLYEINPPGLPDGIMFVRGLDDYPREELGNTVLLVQYPTDELPAAPVDINPITVTAGP